MPEAEDVDELIAIINMEECYRRRTVRGRDLNDWHLQLEAWRRIGNFEAMLQLLGEIIVATEQLEQYDDREPQPYWHEQKAKLHRKRHEYQEEAAVLALWLAHWPLERDRFDQARERIVARLAELHREALV
ncbi:hypothetical protein ACMX2H_16155 [Arthrobacter sulfonylureivorans]|uniref:hypothetical protein n=1 Tax=Arthrobacter sulfonylureivorans TaxID=2486855 RepID=UPI0039E6FBB2